MVELSVHPCRFLYWRFLSQFISFSYENAYKHHHNVSFSHRHLHLWRTIGGSASISKDKEKTRSSKHRSNIVLLYILITLINRTFLCYDIWHHIHLLGPVIIENLWPKKEVFIQISSTRQNDALEISDRKVCWYCWYYPYVNRGYRASCLDVTRVQEVIDRERK